MKAYTDRLQMSRIFAQEASLLGSQVRFAADNFLQRHIFQFLKLSTFA